MAFKPTWFPNGIRTTVVEADTYAGGTEASLFNVKDPTFGAVGDGVTDDTAAFQAALDAAARISEFTDPFQIGSVYVPFSDDNYLIKGTLHIRAGTSFIGQNQLGCRLKFAPDASAWVSPEGHTVMINVQKSWGFLGNTTATGTADSGNTTTVTDTGAFTGLSAGGVVRNTTTGAWGQVTSLTNDTLTHTALVGGSVDSWSAGDGYDYGYTGGNVDTIDIKNFYIFTDDTTTNKMAIRLWDVRDSNVTMVKIGTGSPGWGGVDSVGIGFFGREHNTLDHVNVRANVPLRVFKIEDPALSGENSLDNLRIVQSQFQTTTAPSTLAHAAIIVDEDAQVFRWSFDTINLRGGDYGIYWNCTVATSVSYNVSIRNVHVEQVATNAVCNFYFNFDSSQLQTLLMDSCSYRLTDGSANDVNGLHLKGVKNTVLINPLNRIGDGAGDFINVVSGIESLTWIGGGFTDSTDWTNGQADLFQQWATYDDTHTLPSSASYNVNGLPFKQINVTTGTRVITAAESGTLFTNNSAASTVTFTLPAAVQGMTYEFASMANQSILLDADTAGDLIRGGGAGDLTGSPNGKLTLDANAGNAWGNYARLVALEDGEWNIMGFNGHGTFS